MKKHYRMTFLLLSLLLTGQSVLTQERNNISASLTVDGRERTYILHLPSVYDTRGSLPLVFVLHGGGGNAENARRMSNMNAKADEKGFLVVYPNGTGKRKDRLLTWNAGNCWAYALTPRVDDVTFFHALLEELKQAYPVDSKQIYVTGLSNGGMMAYRLACELSDKIAAVAPIAASLPIQTCNLSSPVSVIVFHRTEDRHVPYFGGIGKEASLKILHPSVSEAVRFWVEHT